MNTRLRHLIENFHAGLQAEGKTPIPPAFLPSDSLAVPFDLADIAKYHLPDLTSNGILGELNKQKIKSPDDKEEDDSQDEENDSILADEDSNQDEKNDSVLVDVNRNICIQYDVKNRSKKNKSFKYIANNLDLEQTSEAFKQLKENLHIYHDQATWGLSGCVQKINIQSLLSPIQQTYKHDAAIFYIDNKLYIYSLCHHAKLYNCEVTLYNLPGSSSALLELNDNGYEIIYFGFSNSLQHDLCLDPTKIDLLNLEHRVELAEHEENAAFQKAARDLNVHLESGKNPSLLQQAKLNVLSEVQRAKSNCKTAKELDDKLPILASVLAETAKDNLDLDKFNDLLKKISDSHTLKRVGAAILALITIALITTFVIMATTATGGLAAPLIAIGTPMLIAEVIAPLIAIILPAVTGIISGILFFQAAKKNPLQESMQQAIDAQPSSP